MKLKEWLRSAKEKIEKFGWIQGSMGSDVLGYCMLGALDAVFPAPMDVFNPDGTCTRVYLDWSNARREAELKIIDAVGYDTGNPWPRLSGWNDKRGRTKEEVLAAFDKAIEALPDPT